MRHFPRIVRHRTASALLAAVMTLGATTAVAAHADDLKDRQRKVENKIDGARQDLGESSAALRRASARLDAAKARLATAQSDLAVARGRLKVAQERDAQMQAELETAEAELAAAEAAVAQGRIDRDAQRQVLADTVADMYAEGDPQLIAFASMLDASSTEELTRRNGVREVVVDSEARAYDELKASEVLLQVREEQVAAARDVVAQKREAAAENLVLKQELESAAEVARESVRTLVGERASARSEARKARAADAVKLRALERQQAQIKELLRRRALAALRKSGGKKGSPDGILSMPVNTYITSPFGYRTHPIYHYWGLHDGVDFGGGCGVPLRAAAGGRVVASYWSDVYGRRLVIDHGAQAGFGLATIYNHASSYTVGVGSRVSRGQVVGYQGNTGWSTACHLHFTVMANGRAVDPMKWF